MRRIALAICLLVVPVVAWAEVVANPATPPGGKVQLPLAELWRLGGESEADEEFFGVINDIAIAPNGDVYVLDAQLHEVRVFDRDGVYLRSMGREGEGPGEFRRPRNVLLMPDGTVGVVQPRPATVVLFTPEGEPAGSLPMPSPEDGGFMFLETIQLRAGRMVAFGANMQMSGESRVRTSRLVGVNLDGSMGDTYLETETEFSAAGLVLNEEERADGWALGPDGRVTRTQGHDYRFTVYAADGSVDHVIERDFEPLTRTDDERQAVEDRLSGRIRFRGRGGNRPPVTVEVSDRDKAIAWFQRRDDGTLWVLNGRSLKEKEDGELGTFDVFDPAGNFAQQVTLLGQGDFGDDRVQMVGDRLFVVTQYQSALAALFGTGSDDEEEELDDDDLIPMEIICYTVDWGEGAGR